jgi:hypothetical protein
MILVKGNPAAAISDIRNVVTVFKAGVGYGPAKLLEAVRGLAGIRQGARKEQPGALLAAIKDCVDLMGGSIFQLTKRDPPDRG